MVQVSSKSNTQLKIVFAPINDLRPAPYNPRMHTDFDEEQLTESVRKFGAVEPLVVNATPRRKNIVISGHFRLEILKKLGYKKVPVIYVNIPSIKREKELSIRMNKNTGRWDTEKLRELFDTDFLLETGFEAEDLTDIWDNNLTIEDDDFDVEREAQAIKNPKSKLGDLYQLGPHRIICGDSQDPSVIKRLVGKNRIDMLYSDPPYNINLDYSSGIGGTRQYGGKTKDNKSNEEYRTFLHTSLSNGLSMCKPDCHIFTFCDQKFVWLLQLLYRELEIDARRTCLWIKNNLNVTSQVAFSKCYEACLYGIRGKPYLSKHAQNFSEILNPEVGTGNRTIDDILDMLDIWLCKRLPTQEYEHPTSKPPRLHERPIRRCTKPGDTILDLFGGGGSTLVSAHQMKRKAFLVDWDPVFVDVTLLRFERLFGIKPTLLKS